MVDAHTHSKGVACCRGGLQLVTGHSCSQQSRLRVFEWHCGKEMHLKRFQGKKFEPNAALYSTP